MLAEFRVVSVCLDHKRHSALLVNRGNRSIVPADPDIIDSHVQIEMASRPQTAVPLRVRKLEFISVGVMRELLFAAEFKLEHRIIISWDLGH